MVGSTILILRSLHSKNCEGSKTLVYRCCMSIMSLHSKNCEGSKTRRGTNNGVE